MQRENVSQGTETVVGNICRNNDMHFVWNLGRLNRKGKQSEK